MIFGRKKKQARADFKVERSGVKRDVLAAIIDPIWFGLNTPYEPDPRLAELTPGQRALYALRWTDAEVGNGGFDQYFTNSTGYLLPEAQEGARTLGSLEWASLLDEARDIFGADYPRDREERTARLEALGEEVQTRLDDLDGRLYALAHEPETNLDALSRWYVETHPEEFFTDTA